VNFAEGYQNLDGYVPEADLSLGCGLPVQHAGISAGDTVLDLGSGAGNDVFVARAVTGPAGRVIGVDMVPDMIDRARENAAKLGAKNVEFHLGEIESLPVPAGEVDVVVSNCVLNLVPDKAAAFGEIFRVLKPGGHFCISDILLEGDLPEDLADTAIMYSGCVAGAQQKDEYLETIATAGFTEVEIKKARDIVLPEDLVLEAVGDQGLADWLASDVAIRSLTVVGVKPL
jgi:arsenite methyltransferase